MKLRAEKEALAEITNQLKWVNEGLKEQSGDLSRVDASQVGEYVICAFKAFKDVLETYKGIAATFPKEAHETSNQ